MDNVLLKSFSEKFGIDYIDKWLHVPKAVVIGRSKEGSKLAAVSIRWLKDTWTGKSTFESWCGFAPSVSRSGTKEIMKAASGLVEEVENVPTSGFKLSLTLNCDELMEGRGAAHPTRQACLMPDCKYSTCGMSSDQFNSYSKPVVAVEDPRGWAVMVSQAQVIKLMAAKACDSADRLELPGPLVYVFGKNGFTLDFPDGELARAAIDDNGVDEVKKSAASSKKTAVLEVGQICADVSKSSQMVYLGMFPQDLTTSQMEMLSSSMQLALISVYKAVKTMLDDISFRLELDSAELAEQKAKIVAEDLRNRLQPFTAQNANEFGYALQAWTKLHEKLVPTFACIGKYKSDGRGFSLSEDFPDVEKHSVESLLAARPDDIDVIKNGVRVKEQKSSWWTRDESPSSRELSGFLKPPSGVFQLNDKKAKELACCTKGFAEADGKLSVTAYDYSVLHKYTTFEYSYQKVITELEARRKWLDSLYNICFELNALSLCYAHTAKSLAESLAADNCKKLKTLFPSLAVRWF